MNNAPHIIKKLINKLGKAGATILAVLTVKSYVAQAPQARELIKDLKLEEAVNGDISINKGITVLSSELREELILETVKRNKIEDLLSSEVLPKLENKPHLTEETKENLVEAFGLIEKVKASVKEAILKWDTSIDECKEFIECVLDLVNSGGKNSSNQFIPWETLSTVYSEVSEVIESLSQTQKGAVIHISFSVVILLCLFTLIGIFYGNILIQYFKLETKFPRLARYIKIRRKFQQFYFAMNSLFIIWILIFIIIFNVIVFLYAH